KEREEIERQKAEMERIRKEREELERQKAEMEKLRKEREELERQKAEMEKLRKEREELERQKAEMEAKARAEAEAKAKAEAEAKAKAKAEAEAKAKAEAEAKAKAEAEARAKAEAEALRKEQEEIEKQKAEIARMKAEAEAAAVAAAAAATAAVTAEAEAEKESPEMAEIRKAREELERQKAELEAMKSSAAKPEEKKDEEKAPVLVPVDDKKDEKKDEAKTPDAEKKENGKKSAARKPEGGVKKPAAGAAKKKSAGATKAIADVLDDLADDPEYRAMLKRKKMKMNMIVFVACFVITAILGLLVWGLKGCSKSKGSPAQKSQIVEKQAGKQSSKAIPQVQQQEEEKGDPEFNKKYKALMEVKASDPSKFESDKLDFITYFQNVASAAGLSKKQLEQYNELAKDYGMEVAVTEETVADAKTEGSEAGGPAKAAPTPGGNPEKSKQYKAAYDKLLKYLNANTHVTRRFSKPAKIMDELDKQLGMMREFIDNWEVFPKTETEQKWYDNVLRIYKKTQQSRDMYSM
ncbi:MAG: hypothetical protein IKZ33_09785, partial [Lentisphaeria bacterium]|nr:hypothetical protein [Lentisphaeria bacterium]